MNLDDTTYEVFDKYLAGKMGNEEREDFLSQLDNDSSLKEAFEFHRSIVAGLRATRREELKDYIKKNANIRYMGNVWSRTWVISSAAIIVLALGSYMVIEYFMKPASQKSDEVVHNTPADANTDSSVARDENNVQSSEQKENQSAPVAPEVAIAEDDIQEQENIKNVTPLPPTNDQAERTEDRIDEKAFRANAQVLASYKAPVISIRKDKNAPEANAPAAESETQNRQVNVSIIKGTEYRYQYDRTTLILTKVKDTDKMDNVAVYELGNASYLNWNKVYYPLKTDGRSYPLVKLGDSSALKTLPPIK